MGGGGGRRVMGGTGGRDCDLWLRGERGGER